MLAQKTEALAQAERRLINNRVDAGSRSARRAQSVNRVAESEENNRSVAAEIEKVQRARQGLVSTEEAQAAARSLLAQKTEALAKAERDLQRVLPNLQSSRASREASNFGFGNAGDPVAKSIRRQQEKQDREQERLLRGNPAQYQLEAAPGGSPYRIMQSAVAQTQQATAQAAKVQSAG